MKYWFFCKIFFIHKNERQWYHFLRIAFLIKYCWIKNFSTWNHHSKGLKEQLYVIKSDCSQKVNMNDSDTDPNVLGSVMKKLLKWLYITNFNSYSYSNSSAKAINMLIMYYKHKILQLFLTKLINIFFSM